MAIQYHAMRKPHAINWSRLMFLAPLLFSVVSVAAACSPSEWRPATREDVQKQVVSLNLPSSERPPSSQRLEVAGDFDGDGRQDRAVLMLNDQAGKMALFVFHRPGGQSVRLSDDADIRGLRNVGLGVLEPGRYATACAKGYGPRGAPCKPQIILRWQGVEFFAFESAASVHYWDGRRFRQDWLTD